MKFENKQQELRFMYVLWLRLLYLQEYLKETGELEFMQVVRECNWRCSNKIERLKDEIQVASKWFGTARKRPCHATRSFSVIFALRRVILLRSDIRLTPSDIGLRPVLWRI